MKCISVLVILLFCNTLGLESFKMRFPKRTIQSTCETIPIKIAIIDTGLLPNKNATLCSTGHIDFSADQEYFIDNLTVVPKDNHGHGTNIAGIIDERLKDSGLNYCLIIIKYYGRGYSGSDNLANEIKAIKHANTVDADVINMSGGGLDYSETETEAVTSFIDRGGILIAAAGNEREDLDEKHYYYPAMSDSRVISVGSAHEINELELMVYRHSKITKQKKLVKLTEENGYFIPSSFSNYGDAISRWESGENVKGFGMVMSGTSQATALATSKIVSHMENKCKK